MKKLTYLLIINLIFLFFLKCTFAQEIGFVNNNIWLSDNNPIAGQEINIYAIIINSSDYPIEGYVQFINNFTQNTIGESIAFNITGKGTSKVISVPWKAEQGNHQFKAQIVNAFIDKNNERIPLNGNTLSKFTEVIFIDIDSDNDGLPNEKEIKLGTDIDNPDTDNDGLSDSQDPNPINNDTDNDGDLDGTDPEPENPNVYTEPDTDNDGIIDKEDSDIDNDGLYNWEEEEIGTSSKIYDTDNDGISDKEDAYPTDPSNTNTNNTNINENTDKNLVKNDNITDNKELSYKINLTDTAEKNPSDYDNDGIFNWIEILLGTDPKNKDTNKLQELTDTNEDTTNSLEKNKSILNNQKPLFGIINNGEQKNSSYIQSHSFLGMLMNLPYKTMPYLIYLILILLLIISIVYDAKLNKVPVRNKKSTR